MIAREQLVKLAQQAIANHRPSRSGGVVVPHEWVYDAMQLAYEQGQLSVPGLREHLESLALIQGEQMTELRDALSQMLDMFGDHLDKHVLREYRALVRGPAAEGVPDAPIEGGA